MKDNDLRICSITSPMDISAENASTCERYNNTESEKIVFLSCKSNPMKKLILILSLTISMTTTHSQAVLEHIYINQSVANPIKLSNNEWIYAVLPYTSFPPTDVKIYSSSRIYSLPGTMVDVPPQSTELEQSASPNPCKDLIEISHPINAVRIRIISVEGKEVYRVNTGMALSTKVQTMSFPTGIYIFEVTLSDQRKLTGKFIKR